eukprot:898668-Prorocentrum_minimum.AAC.4
MAALEQDPAKVFTIFAAQAAIYGSISAADVSLGSAVREIPSPPPSPPGDRFTGAQPFVKRPFYFFLFFCYYCCCYYNTLSAANGAVVLFRVS